MKKIFLLTIILFSTTFFSQVSTLIIKNYSNYTLTGRLRATDLTNCIPELYMGNTLGTGNFTIPPTTSTSYDKFYNSNTSVVPVFDYLVRTNYNSPASLRPYNHPVITTISPTTEWSFYDFFTSDPLNSGTASDHFTIGVSPCASSYPTNQIGTFSEVEWFSISNGGTTFSYIQIY